MRAQGTRRMGLSVALGIAAVGIMMLALPTVALAAWTGVSADIVDPYGTGYTDFLNVRVRTTAVNDASPVRWVQLSDDGEQWLTVPYTGTAVDWVLPGESGEKQVLVRYQSADGSVSDVVSDGIVADTAPPRTRALNEVRVSPGGTATFRYRVTDATSPRALVRLQLRRAGGGVVKTVRLGWKQTGVVQQVRLAPGLARGRYTWSVTAMDLAHWVQSRQGRCTLVVR